MIAPVPVNRFARFAADATMPGVLSALIIQVLNRERLARKGLDPKRPLTSLRVGSELAGSYRAQSRRRISPACSSSSRTTRSASPPTSASAGTARSRPSVFSRSASHSGLSMRRARSATASLRSCVTPPSAARRLASSARSR